MSKESLESDGNIVDKGLIVFKSALILFLLGIIATKTINCLKAGDSPPTKPDDTVITL